MYKISEVKYSGGAYVVNAVLALSAFTQNSIGQDEYLTNRDVLNMSNQFSWRIIANNTIVDAEKGSWITKTEYSESIRNVIGKAIADCITEKNEFAGKKENEVIKFKADPTKVKYSPANWNAVVLWNLIHVCKQEYKKYDEFDMEFDSEFDIEKAFKTVGERVKEEYKAIDAINTKIEDAIHDIRSYEYKLALGAQLKEFFKIGKFSMLEINQPFVMLVNDLGAIYPKLISPYIDLTKAKLADAKPINGQYKYQEVLFVDTVDLGNNGRPALKIQNEDKIYWVGFSIGYKKEKLGLTTIKFSVIHYEDKVSGPTWIFYSNVNTEDVRKKFKKIIAEAMEALALDEAKKYYLCDELGETLDYIKGR